MISILCRSEVLQLCTSMRSLAQICVSALLLASCASGNSTGWLFSKPASEGQAPARGSMPILNPATYEEDNWTHMRIRGETDYRVTSLDGARVITATGNNSASGLIRHIDLDPSACPILRWHWRVDRLQPSADLTTKDGDDVGAAVFVMFGDPGSTLSPNRVPTLRYVWTNARAQEEAVIANPYLPNEVKNIVVRRGAEYVGQGMQEQRNLTDDYRRAFGGDPPDIVRAVAIFSDNDQTGEPVTAHYRSIEAVCGEDRNTPARRVAEGRMRAGRPYIETSRPGESVK